MAACKCGKTVSYRDRIAAQLALARLQRKDDPNRRQEQRVYRCQYQRWHLTSK